MKTNEELVATILKMRAFLPAKDFENSRRFYECLGFQPTKINEKSLEMRLGSASSAFSFFLQDFYVKELAENLMMQVLVKDIDAWWNHIARLALEKRFEVVPPRQPTLQPWGLRVAYVWDPSGILWHIASDE